MLIILDAYSRPDDTLSYDLDEVIITASRNSKLLKKSPEVVQVIDSKDVEQLNVRSTGEILEYLTGVNIETGTGSGSPKRSIVSLDGFPAKHTLVMVDGVIMLTEHIHSGQNIDIVPPENIERIEVIKGAASAQYGSDAMGGVVNIITKKASNEPSSSISFSGGSYETYDGAISVRTPVNEQVSISSFSDYEQSAGTPILSPAHRIGNMGYNKFSTLNNLVWDINQQSSLKSNIFYSHNMMEFLDDNVYSRQLLSSMDYSHELADRLSFFARLKYAYWDAELSGEKNELLNPEVYFVWDQLSHHLLTWGTDFKYSQFTRSAVPERSQNAIGVFVQDEIDFNKFSFLLACRMDKVEEIKPILTPKLAAMYQASDKMRLRASFGRGFHAPTIQELYEKGYGHGGRAYRFGNPDLKPEYSLTSTFSIEYAPVRNLELMAHAYYNTITDMITPVYKGVWEDNPDTSSVIDKWVRTNIHEAEIYGIEVSFRYRLNNNFSVEGGYNYADNQNITTGGQLPYYPGESYSAKVIYGHDLSAKLSFSGFISLSATNGRSAWNWKPAKDQDDDNPDGLITELDNYQLLNAGLKFIHNEQLSLYLNMGNILGQNIQKLDDLYTEIDGEPTWRLGCLIDF